MNYDSYLLSPSVCNEHSIVQYMVDPNGNKINTAAPLVSSTPPLDTMGRPTWPLQNGTFSSDSQDCVNTFPFNQALLMTSQGVNGSSNQIKVCYGSFTPQTAFNVPNMTEYQNFGTVNPIVQPTTVILPDGNKWVFSYDTYGDVINMQLPTGGSISYSWKILVPGIESVCILNSPWNPLPAARAIDTRTVVDNNGTTYTWHYHWGAVQSDNSVTNWVTDPAGNDTVHVFKAVASTQCFGSGSSATGPGLHETTTQYWQGLKDSGVLLKQVDTGYARATMLADSSGFQHEANVVPTDIETAVFPSNKVSLIHNDCDSAYGASAPTLGNVVSEKAYDWGIGAHGALLRETDTVYQWQKNSAYLTANLLDLRASTIVVSPVASENVKPSCPVSLSRSAACAAETDYFYDEVAPQAHLGTPPAGSLVNPPNAVRGNLTSVSKWLDTANSLVSSQNVWFDTGTVSQAKDPLGHTTTYGYDSTDTYLTQTCNPKNQCVYGTNDLNTGLITSFTDIDGSGAGDAAHTITYGYDASTARLATATMPPDPGNNGLKAQTRFRYSDIVNPNVYPIAVSRTRPITGALTDSSTTTFDGLGRPYKTEHAMPSGSPATVVTTFDDVHSQLIVTNPYFSTADSTYGSTTTLSDPLGRAVQVSEQDAVSVVPNSVLSRA